MFKNLFWNSILCRISEILHKTSLEKILFYVFILSIPFQTRKVLFAFSTDKFLEWNSGFFYFTDLLIISILFLWIIRLVRTKSDFLGKSDFWLFGFFLIAGLSLITSQNIELSIYQLIKLTEFILLFLYIKRNLEFLKIKKILTIVVASGVFQSLIAIAQFFNQSSLGLKYFEAGIFNANIPGVATFFVEGTKFIRAYGTTPHPNVLAVFLLFSIFCLYSLWKSDFRGKSDFAKLIIHNSCFIILFLGLLLTFSRAVILVFIAASLLYFLINILLKRKIVSLLILFAVVCCLFTVLFWPEVSARFLTISTKEQAVTLRVYYNDIAISTIKEKPLLGLGLGNFVWHLLNNYQLKEFWLYQPVHNLYLLIASEIGIFGLIFFLVFLARIIFKNLTRLSLVNACFLFIISCFLLLGLIDHYFWTIQQSGLLFWIVLGILKYQHSLTTK